MRFFPLNDLLRKRIPTLDDFRSAKNEINNLVLENSEILTNALWWGSSATETWKPTSDLDLVFVYQIKNTPWVISLLGQMQEIAHLKNIPLEVMCLPEEIYLSQKNNIDLSSASAILEYQELETSVIFQDKKLHLGQFGFYPNRMGNTFIKEMHQSHTDYVLHKLDKWIRCFSEWDFLSKADKIKIAGKFIGAPDHVMRRKSQAEGYSSIGFEKNLHSLNLDEDVLLSYSKIEEMKKEYLEKLICFRFNEKSIRPETDYSQYESLLNLFMIRVMSEVGIFLELSATKL